MSNLKFDNGRTTMVSINPIAPHVLMDYLGNIWEDNLGTYPFAVTLRSTTGYGERIPVHLLGMREGYPTMEKGDFWGCNGYCQAVWCSGTVNAGDLVCAGPSGCVMTFDSGTLPSGTYYIVGMAVWGGTNEIISINDCVPYSVVVP